MESPGNSSQSRVDEKGVAQTNNNVLAKEHSHQEIVGQRNGGDEEDPEGLGPVRYGQHSKLTFGDSLTLQDDFRSFHGLHSNGLFMDGQPDSGLLVW